MALARDKALRLAGRAAAVLALVVALLGAGELVARALVPPPVPMLGRYPLAGVVWTPGYKVDRLSLDSPPERFTFEVDALGFRGKSLATAEKPKGTYRIFFLGASTTENAFFPDERTFPGRVEAALGERLKGSPRVEVANGGVAGATTEQVLDCLLHRVLRLDPDLVVVLEGHNELCLALEPGWDPRALGPPEPPPRFKDWLVGASRLFGSLEDWSARRRVADKHGWYRKRAEERRSRPYESPTFEVTRGVPSFEVSLHRVALVCQDARVPLVLMTQPSLYKATLSPEEEAALITGSGGLPNLAPADLKKGLDAYNEAVRRVAAGDRCRLVDLAREVPPNLEHFLDDVHFTAKGNAAVADSVLRAILEGGSLPAAAPR